MIVYRDGAEGLEAGQLTGFFVGWSQPPSPENHVRILRGSDFCVLAVDDATGNVVGFITAISDGVASAFIPFLEVLPEYQGWASGANWCGVCRNACRISTW
ncbi:MAG: hypothetical protein OHK0029_13940 [Armatimonadaceae bacterium]